jgi:hypothetical protein
VKLDLVNKDSNHVTFGSLQRPESATKVELRIVLFAFHTDAQQDTAVAVIQVQPKVMSQEVAIPARVQADIGSTDSVVFSNKCAIAYADHQPQRLLDRNVKRFVPWIN